MGTTIQNYDFAVDGAASTVTFDITGAQWIDYVFFDMVCASAQRTYMRLGTGPSTFYTGSTDYKRFTLDATADAGPTGDKMRLSESSTSPRYLTGEIWGIGSGLYPAGFCHNFNEAGGSDVNLSAMQLEKSAAITHVQFFSESGANFTSGQIQIRAHSGYGLTEGQHDFGASPSSDVTVNFPLGVRRVGCVGFGIRESGSGLSSPLIELGTAAAFYSTLGDYNLWIIEDTTEAAAIPNDRWANLGYPDSASFANYGVFSMGGIEEEMTPYAQSLKYRTGRGTMEYGQFIDNTDEVTRIRCVPSAGVAFDTGVFQYHLFGG
jgi:hypothetical protein